ncbi:MAG: hypothetical protein JWO11_3857 [Nocardioides sp.]|nr:hypothetical protein [Nocardioides sp.]
MAARSPGEPATYPAPVPESAFETASWARRVLALVVDWIACTLVVLVFVGPANYYGADNQYAQLYVFAAYLVEASVLTSLAGGSFGQLATRLRVVSISGGPVPLLRSLVRHVLVLLVIPPLVYRPDGRGLHDIAAGTATVTLQTYRALAGR